MAYSRTQAVPPKLLPRDRPILGSGTLGVWLLEALLYFFGHSGWPCGCDGTFFSASFTNDMEEPDITKLRMASLIRRGAGVSGTLRDWGCRYRGPIWTSWQDAVSGGRNKIKNALAGGAPTTSRLPLCCRMGRPAHGYETRYAIFMIT